MTIKTNEFWINEPFQDIVRKIKSETLLVKFGPFNSYKKTYNFPVPWIGEVYEQTQSFKLFRTKGSENTSDLSVVGKYTTRGSSVVIEVKHKVHFTVFFGMVGLLVLVIAVVSLFRQKNIIVPIPVQVIALAMVIFYYAFTILKDLRQDEKAVESLLTKKLIDLDEVADDDEEEDIEDYDED